MNYSLALLIAWISFWFGVRYERGAIVRRSKTRQKWRDSALNKHKDRLEE